MDKFIYILKNYLTQKTTYIGIFTLLSTFGITLGDKLTEAICACFLGIFGLIYVILDERKDKKEE